PSEVLRALKYFRYRHHEVIVLQVLDRDEREFPYSGENVFVQLEGKKELFADSGALAAEYRRLFARFLDSCKNGFRQAGIDYHLVTTDTPLEKALARILSARS
ncbi:MAG: DUF58 domain-containing protein, partial [Endomicrobiales bacterium]